MLTSLLVEVDPDVLAVLCCPLGSVVSLSVDYFAFAGGPRDACYALLSPRICSIFSARQEV